MTGQGTLDIPADHPSFEGHFPRFPVLPGAVLLDEALQVLQRERGIDLTQWTIASAKFLQVVRPGDALRLEHETPKNGLIRFAIHVSNRIVATGSLSRAAPQPLHPASPGSPPQSLPSPPSRLT